MMLDSPLGIGILVYRLGRKFGLRQLFAFLGGLSALAAGRFAWIAPSGMETAAFTLVSLCVLWLWTGSVAKEGIPWHVSLLFGLAGLLRPEGYLFLALSGLEWLLVTGRGFSLLNKLRVLLTHFCVAGSVVVPYAVFSLVTAGHILPNTFYVVTAQALSRGM